MTKFHATARNAAGLTFRFTFFNENWNEIATAAREALDRIVSQDSLHQKNGPWQFEAIDVTL